MLGKFKLTGKDKEELQEEVVEYHDALKEGKSPTSYEELSQSQVEEKGIIMFGWVVLEVIIVGMSILLSMVIPGNTVLLFVSSYLICRGFILLEVYVFYHMDGRSRIDSFKLSFNESNYPIYLIVRKFKGIREFKLTPAMQEHYNKYLVVKTFEEVVWYNLNYIEDVNTNFEEILNFLNTEVEIKTSKEVGYVTYLYRLLKLDEDEIKLSTLKLYMGDSIPNLEDKRVLITDDKLNYESMVELHTKLEKQYQLGKEYQYNLKALKELKDKEEQRLKHIVYMEEVMSEYQESKEEAQQHLTEHVLKDKWGEVLEGINTEREKLTEENQRLIEEMKG